MTGTQRLVRLFAVSFALAGAAAITGCAGSRERVVLAPGVQVADATVDVEACSVAAERRGVVVTAQAATMPAPRGGSLHPTFWVTIENTREDKISVQPARARIERSVSDMRLVVPDVALRADEGPAEAFDFELAFEQVVEVEQR